MRWILLGCLEEFLVNWILKSFRIKDIKSSRFRFQICLKLISSLRLNVKIYIVTKKFLIEFYRSRRVFFLFCLQSRRCGEHLGLDFCKYIKCSTSVSTVCEHCMSQKQKINCFLERFARLQFHLFEVAWGEFVSWTSSCAMQIIGYWFCCNVVDWISIWNSSNSYNLINPAKISATFLRFYDRLAKNWSEKIKFLSFRSIGNFRKNFQLKCNQVRNELFHPFPSFDCRDQINFFLGNPDGINTAEEKKEIRNFAFHRFLISIPPFRVH